MKKIYVVGADTAYANWLCEIGFEITGEVDKADVFMFTGGEDVTPALYKHKCLPRTYNNVLRDKYEVAYFGLARERHLPMIGVCRGSQFLGAMSGAKLVQDMSHPYLHEVETFDGKRLIANSTHHQAVFIPEEMEEGKDYKLLAWAKNLSPFHSIADDKIKFSKDYRETECTWWYKTRCFGIQPHPEDTLGTPWNKWLQQEIVKYIPVV